MTVDLYAMHLLFIHQQSFEPFLAKFHNHSTSTSSVLQYGNILSEILSFFPALHSNQPCHAIIAPLSVRNSRSGQNDCAPRSSHIILHISCNRALHATPPPSTSSFFPVCAKALSATSTSIANTVS